MRVRITARFVDSLAKVIDMSTYLDQPEEDLQAWVDLCNSMGACGYWSERVPYPEPRRVN